MMDLMDDELRRVLSGSVDAPTDSMARELDRLRVRDRGPTVTERAAASQPSFRMPSSGRRRPEQRGGGEALEALGSTILGSVPAGLAGAAVLPFQGPEGAAKTIGRVQDYLTIDPQTEGGDKALLGILKALSPLGAPAQALGDTTLRLTGSPLAATAAEVLLDPLNAAGVLAAAKPAARAAAAGARQVGKAAKATGQSLGPKAAEMAEAYMRRSGMTPEITTYHGTPHTFPAEPGLPLGRFRAEKIGSGEGAQVYGHGAYLAESPKVGKRYQETLSLNRGLFDLVDKKTGAPIPENTPGFSEVFDSLKSYGSDLRSSDISAFKDRWINHKKNYNERLKEIRGLREEWAGTPMLEHVNQMYSDTLARIKELDAAASLVDKVKRQPGGSFYTVDLPDPMVNQMLDWDRPISEQSELVQSIAKKLDTNPSLRGAALYNQAQLKADLGEGPLAPAASEWFRGQGIPGIKYLDEGSRGAGEGTRNFVVFPGEEDKLTILQRNGQRLDAEIYKEKLLSTLPQIVQFFEKNSKGWRPSEKEMLASVEAGYTVMKHTGDVKQAGKAVMDELNTLYRMSEGQSGLQRNDERLPKTDTPAFKQFAGGAPVVSLGSASKHEFQTGKPVVIEGLHGTKFDFAEVDPARSSAGYFMTDRPVVSNEYAGVYPEGRGGGHFPTGGNVQRSFVRMDNPLFVNARGASFNRLDTRGVPGFGLPMSNTDMLNQWAKQQGYDGVIYKDLRDSISAPGGGNAPASNVFVSFKPNYVKSATGNRGTYDIQQRDMTKADGGLIGETMSFTTAADTIADKLMRQGMDPDQAFMTALRMSDARMKAGGAVLMAGGGDTERELTLQARNRNLAALDRALAPRARKTWDGPMIDRPIVNGKSLVSAEELADFRRRFGEKMTLRDLLNADKGRGPSGASPAARGVQGANVAPRGPLIRPDEAATLPPVGLSDIPGLVMRGMAEGAERVPAGRGAGAAFVGAALPRALSAGTTAAKTLRDHPSISPERRQMLKEMEDYISGLNQADRPAVDPKMRALEERLEPPMQVGGPVKKLTARAAARAEARLAEKAAKESAEKAAKQAAIDARTEDEKSVLEKFGQKKKQEAARTKKVREMEEKIDVPVSPKRTVASSYSAVPPDIYRQMEAQLGPDAVMKAVEAGHHLKPTPSGYVGAPRTVTNQQSLGAMRRAMDKDFADSVQAVRVADPERLGTWYDRAKLGIAESSTPSQLDRTLEQHGVYSAGVSPESELGFALKHLNSRVAGEPAMAYRGAPMRTLDEAVAQGIPANMGFKIGEYMNKNDPRIPNAGLFGVNDFRRAQGMGYTDPAGEPWRAGVTDTMHPFMDAETALQVGRSNRDKIGGRPDWAGPHIQELPWVYGKGQDLYSRGETGRFAGDELAGIKQALVEANNTARDYMYKHAGSSTHEAIPGASTGHVPQMITAPLADRLKYTETGRWDRPMPEMPLPDAPGVGAGLRDVIYSALGFRQLPSVRASGAFFPEGATVPEHQPVTIARPLLDFPTGGGAEISTPTRQTLDFAERFRALMDAQEAFGYNLPNTMGAIPGKNAVVLDTRSRNPNKLKEPHTGLRPDEQQMASLTNLLEDTGYGIAPTSRGATIFPFSPTSSTSDIKKLLKEKGAEIQSIFPSEFDLSKNTMGYGPGVGIYTPEGFKASEPFSGQATTALLKEASLLPENVARNLSESEAVRTAIKEKSARDAPLAGARSDIQETRRFFGGEDWAKAVDMIRKGMTPAAALAALGYSSLSMAEEASR